MKRAQHLFQPLAPGRFRRRVFGQLWMLALQFLLGMLLNLIGSETTGWLHGVYVTVLILHIMNAIGLVEGGVYIVMKQRSRLTYTAGVVTGVTFVSGLMTTWTGQNGWSFVMACGFGLAAWLYATVYIRESSNI